MRLPFITSEQIFQSVDYPSLIKIIKAGFASEELRTPERHHHYYNESDTLLLMPAWEKNKDLGVKIISSNPNNGSLNIPSINGVYILFDYGTGIPKALFDAKALTSIRTAATSALAADLVANNKRRSMLMIGTGALAPELIKAHCAVSDIRDVYVWGRDFSKAQAVVDSLALDGHSIKAVASTGEVVQKVDLISTATYSKEPLIFGCDLQQGQHIDLVGSFTTMMRESDDEAMQRATIYVDSYEGALSSCGDLVIPMQNGSITKSDIKADLFELCKGEKVGRNNVQDITLFKSVGHGLEDLVAARYFYNCVVKTDVR